MHINTIYRHILEHALICLVGDTRIVLKIITMR